MAEEAEERFSPRADLGRAWLRWCPLSLRWGLSESSLIRSLWSPRLPCVTKNSKQSQQWFSPATGWTLADALWCQQILPQFLPHSLLRNISPLHSVDPERWGVGLYVYDPCRPKEPSLAPVSCFCILSGAICGMRVELCLCLKKLCGPLSCFMDQDLLA